MTNAQSTNTYIFTEKDLPGYRTKGQGPAKPAAFAGVAKGSSHLPSPKQQMSGPPRWEKGRRTGPYFKKAVPSMLIGLRDGMTLTLTEQTALAGVVKHEMSCVPVDGEEEARYLERKAKGSSKPRETMFINGVGPVAGNLLDPGTMGSGGSFGGFIVRVTVSNGTKLR